MLSPIPKLIILLLTTYLLTGCSGEDGAPDNTTHTQEDIGLGDDSAQDTEIPNEDGNETVQICAAVYAPMCGVIQKNEPCQTAPCIGDFYQNFSNRCHAENQKATSITEGQCAYEGLVTPHEPGTPMICTLDYRPVCALVSPFKNCTSELCENSQETGQSTQEYRYQEFSNLCASQNVIATVFKEGECGSIKYQVSEGKPPIILSSSLPQSTATLENITINEDTLHLTLSYPGCTKRHVDTLISTQFMESFPVGVNMRFVVAGLPEKCRAIKVSEHTYDLAPLKHYYQDAYKTQEGTIDFGSVLYDF